MMNVLQNLSRLSCMSMSAASQFSRIGLVLGQHNHQKLVGPSLCISTSSPLAKFGDKPKHFMLYNEVIYPPTEVNKKIRPAYICHQKALLKYSPLKMWYVACFVRGMPIEEAIRQLEYVAKKGANFVKETLIEAQEMAVKQHNVEFKTNLWVAESFVGKGGMIKGIRRHARSRIGVIKYRYCHYFCRLEEGSPPPGYTMNPEPDGPTLLQQWIQERRDLRLHATY